MIYLTPFTFNWYNIPVDIVRIIDSVIYHHQVMNSNCISAVSVTCPNEAIVQFASVLWYIQLIYNLKLDSKFCMKAHTSFTPNKKLILHFDLHNVLVLAPPDKDLFVRYL